MYKSPFLQSPVPPTAALCWARSPPAGGKKSPLWYKMLSPWLCAGTNAQEHRGGCLRSLWPEAMEESQILVWCPRDPSLVCEAPAVRLHGSELRFSGPRPDAQSCLRDRIVASMNPVTPLCGSEYV